MTNRPNTQSARVAIIDYGVGNLFSVKHACETVGLEAAITSEKSAVVTADAVFLPGVGAFGDAIETLNRLDLVRPLIEIATSEKPLIGICLGFQLFMTEGFEFGRHKGLGIIDGSVVPFENPADNHRKLKVPQVGWNSINRRSRKTMNDLGDPWQGSPLADLPNEAFMYFVHSFYVQAEDPELILSTSKYGDIEFCSSLMKNNVFACQFHPERSGRSGLQVYRNIASFIRERALAQENQTCL